MAWDDLHEAGNSQDKPRGGGGSHKGGGSGGGPQFEIPQIKLPKFKGSTIILALVAVLALWIIPSVYYSVGQDEEGVVTRFGKYVRTTQPGPHFKLPSPIEHVFKPKVRQVRRVEIGFRTDQGRTRDFPNESLMLTGDQNIVDIDVVVQYHIIDANHYLFNVRRQEKAVHNVAETVMRGIIGSKKIDEALTTGKAEIQILLKEQMQGLLDKYKSGIQIVTTQLQNVSPPAQVVSAFKDVVSAREDKERMINEAQGYRNAVIPEARGKAAQIVRMAEGYQQEVIKKAEGDAARFLAQYREYKKAPEVTRKRIYLETMEEIYPKMNKFVIGNQSGVVPILPLGPGLENLMGRSK